MPLSARTSSFRRLVIRAAALPVVLLLILAAVLLWQVQRLLSTAERVEHTDHVIARANELQRLTVDMESGLRGYLITQQPAFLEPFTHGQSQFDPVRASLRDLVKDNPLQVARLDGIAAVQRGWQSYAERELQLRDTGGDWEAAVKAGVGRTGMIDLRRRFGELIGHEERLRSQRSADAKLAARWAVWGSIAAALGVGGLLAFLSGREFGRLARTYEAALSNSAALTSELERRVAERTAELGQANGSLERSNAALGEANSELEAFAYSISHDLRAPLRHITGFAALLKRSPTAKLSPDDAENLDTIVDTAKTAGRMVDDLLAFSRIGRAELHRERIDLNALVARCRKDLEPETKDRSVTWTVGDLPDAEGDPALLKLVVANLLGNAVKYTSKRTDATIDVSGTANDDGTATYCVRDNGVGFDMAYAHKLFGVFQRLHRAEEYEGNGIGLANVRRIVTRHGGRTWAEGELDRGATFCFTLPRRQ